MKILADWRYTSTIFDFGSGQTVRNGMLEDYAFFNIRFAECAATVPITTITTFSLVLPAAVIFSNGTPEFVVGFLHFMLLYVTTLPQLQSFLLAIAVGARTAVEKIHKQADVLLARFTFQIIQLSRQSFVSSSCCTDSTQNVCAFVPEFIHTLNTVTSISIRFDVPIGSSMADKWLQECTIN
jgi:hypothetical protein